MDTEYLQIRGGFFWGMRMRLWIWIGGTVAVCCAAALVVTGNVHAPTRTEAPKTGISRALPKSEYASVPTSAVQRAISKNHKLTVMAVGGSSAQGYDDPTLDGYLARALRTVSTTLHIPITFVNKAKSGDIPTMLAPEYDPLVRSIHPDVVIISWGLLNDISKKTPTTMFQRVIQSEVSMALKAGADVWIVTPPPTPATYVGHDVKLETEYARLEIQGARAVHSSQVNVFDLLDAMKKYLQDHHLSYKPYASNNWHLNRAGHILAGQILADEILQRANSIGLT